MEQVIFQSTRNYPTILPTKAHKSDVGYDLRYYPLAQESARLRFGDVAVFECGVRVMLPQNHFGMICSRSGLAINGIFVVNAPGIIDPEYRGELKVILGHINNITHNDYIINCGDRIAQLVILPIANLSDVAGYVYTNTERGEKGFGSSGNE